MVGVGANDNPKDRIIIRLCILESFQYHRAHGICSAVATGRIIERITITCRNVLAVHWPGSKEVRPSTDRLSTESVRDQVQRNYQDS